ncbi:MAG: type IV toxin-antitoxin system AbiEi family antitoxin [Faecousia sp.]
MTRLKYYEKLVQLGCFSREKLIEITGSEAAAKSLVLNYLNKGYIERVRRDLYVAISLETHQPVFSRYQIASHIADDACVSHHSAFEYYGYANQVFYEIYVATDSRFRDFEYDGVSYHRVAPTDGIKLPAMQSGVRVTELEQTVIDSIADLQKIGGLEEILRCIQLIPSLNADKLLAVLSAYGNGLLYQKTGYILESFNNSLNLPNSFFSECEAHCSKSKKYLSSDHKDYVFHAKWKLFAPKDLSTLINKGVTDFDAI